MSTLRGSEHPQGAFQGSLRAGSGSSRGAHLRDAIAGLRPSAQCSCPVRSLDPTRGLTAGVRCKGHERPRAGFGLPARTQGSGPGAAQGQSGRVRSDRQPLARQGTASAWARVGDAPALTLGHDAVTKGGRRGASHVADRTGGDKGWPPRTLVLMDSRQEQFDSERVQLQPYGVQVWEPLPRKPPSVISWHQIQQMRRESESGETWGN